MKLTTLCYIEKNGRYLMLLRNKKKNDCNEGKWVGIGGKFRENETPDECLLREVKEETGVVLTEYHFYGIIRFVSDRWEDEAMYLYSASGYDGEIDYDCDEGELRWIDKEDVMKLNLWEGDRLFLVRMLNGEERFNMTLRYEGETLAEACDDTYEV